MPKMIKSLKTCGKGDIIKMNKKQYNNVIENTLKHEQTDDSLSTARAIFDNMGVALPQGDIKTVYETIKTDNYMGWKSCTMQEAQAAADRGVAAIGISQDKIVVLSANDEEQPVTQTASVMTLSENTSAYSVEGLEYYSYSYGLTTNPTIYCSNSYLTQSQMTSNAQYILNFLRARGWTKVAVASLLGNMQVESTINPGIWEDFEKNNMNKGFGLVQWTPASKYINWANTNCLNYLDIDSQLLRIIDEVYNNTDGQWIRTSEYPMTFYEFTRSYHPPRELVATFMYNYERPRDYSTLNERERYALYWYNNLI